MPSRIEPEAVEPSSVGPQASSRIRQEDIPQ